MSEPRRLRIFGAVGVNNYSPMDGLWRALGETDYVSLWGAGRPGYVKGTPLKEVIGDGPPPDLVLVADPVRGDQDFWDVRGIDAPVVGIFTDTWQMQNNRIEWVKSQPIKALLLRIRSHVEEYKKALPGVRVRWLPFGFNERVFHHYGQERVHDVSLFGCTVHKRRDQYAARAKAQEVLRKQTKFEFADCSSPGRDQPSGEAYARTIGRARIGVTTGSRYNIVLQKHYEIPACGTLLVTTPCPDDLPAVFDASKHIRVCKSDCSNLVSIIEELLADPEGLKKVAKAGCEHVRAKHTDAQRALWFWRLVGDLVPGRRS